MKPGDTVRCVKTCGDVEIGRIYEIERIYALDGMSALIIKGSYRYYFAGVFEPCTPQRTFPYILRDLLELGNSLENKPGKRARRALHDGDC